MPDVFTVFLNKDDDDNDDDGSFQLAPPPPSKITCWDDEIKEPYYTVRTYIHFQLFNLEFRVAKDKQVTSIVLNTAKILKLQHSKILYHYIL